MLFLIPHLGGGGAERVTAQLAAGLPAHKYDVHLGLAAQGSFSGEPLPDSVTIHDLRARRVRGAALPLLRLIWKLKPDLIFSCMYHLNFLVLLIRPVLPSRTRYIVRQNGLLSAPTQRPTLTRVLYRHLYPRAEKIVCQTDEMATDMRSLLGTDTKLSVLPNPVAMPTSTTEHSQTLWTAKGPRLLAIGRLVQEKGFDLLLEAFAEISKHFPAAQLTILGQGPLERPLKDMARSLGITAQVNFPGYVSRPQEWLTGATAFVLSSRSEGLSNAMLEAAAAGLPIIAMPAQGGVRRLLEGNPGCWVAPELTHQALASTLIEALNKLRCEERFAHAWIDEFRMENALQRYESLFDEVLAGARA